jgi:hypothetical protein
MIAGLCPSLALLKLLPTLLLLPGTGSSSSSHQTQLWQQAW